MKKSVVLNGEDFSLLSGVIDVFGKKGSSETVFSNQEILKEENALLKCFKNNTSSTKILFGLFANQKKNLTVSSIFFILKSIPGLVIPLITAEVINLVVKQTDDTIYKILLLGLFAVLLIVENYFTAMVHIKAFSKAKRSVEASLRGAMVRKLQQLSISFHKDTQSGKLQSKIMRDVEAIEGMIAQVFTSLLGVAFSLTGTFIIILAKDYRIFGIILLIAPIAGFICSRFRKKIRDTNRVFREDIEKTSSDIMDMIELIPVTRAHALENREIEKFTNEVTEVAKSGYKVDYTQTRFFAFQYVTFTFFEIVCLVISGILACKGIIKQVGDIALYQTYFTQIVNQVNSMLNLIPNIAKGSESLYSIGEILNSDNIEPNENKESVTKLRGEYDFRDVTFSYDNGVQILNGVNFHVNPGETVALVGESGSGKSTLMNLVIGFNTVSGGELLVDGKPLSEIDLRSYRQFISVVPQNTVLFSGTVRDNITYGRDDISETELNYVIDMARLRSVIDMLPDGLDTKIGEHGGKLSGGQRQRIAIARAIIRHPDVIIFDEATSALDSQTEKEIQEAIDELAIGRTTFIVAHRLSTIRNADKIAVIKEGRCVEIGSYEELMNKKGEFYHLKQLQA